MLRWGAQAAWGIARPLAANAADSGIRRINISVHSGKLVPGVGDVLGVRPSLATLMAHTSAGFFSWASRVRSPTLGIRTLCAPAAQPSPPKTEAAQTSPPKKTQDVGKWKTFFKEHKDELLNIFLAAFLVIITLRMLREKGEKLDEKNSMEREIVELKTELDRIKTDLVAKVGAEVPKIAIASGVRASNADALTSKVLGLIQAVLVKDAGAPSTTKTEPPPPPVPMQTNVKRGLM